MIEVRPRFRTTRWVYEMAWKPLETRPQRREWCPRGRGPVPRTGQCRHDKGKTARDGTQGPMKKRADLLLVRISQGRDPRTQEEKSGPTAGKRAQPTAGKNLRRLAMEGRPRADGWREAHTCNDVYQVEKQSPVPHSRSATRSQQHHLRCTGRRINNELGKRDCVIGTALEQGSCETGAARTRRRRLLTAEVSSCSPPTRPTLLSRCRGRNPVSQNAFSKIPR